MNATEQADQLELAAKILREGLEWEAWNDLREEWTYYPNSIFLCMEAGRKIRIKPQGAVPVPEGYMELSGGEKLRWAISRWRHTADTRGCYASSNQRIIVPTPPKQVPLEPSDVPPGSVIRIKSATMPYWVTVTHCGPSGLGYNNGSFGEVLGYSELFANWEILRPTDTEWQPCSKPETTKP